MLAQLRRSHRFIRSGISIVSSAVLVLGLCSCQTAGDLDITGSLGDKAEASRAADPRREVDTYRERFRANSKDRRSGLAICQGAAGHGAKGPSGRSA